MKIVTIKGLWLLHWCIKFHIDIASRSLVIGVWNVENRMHTYTYTRIHTHTFGRQLKIKFLDVLNYSQYSDTNISNFFSRKWKKKVQFSNFYFLITHGGCKKRKNCNRMSEKKKFSPFDECFVCLRRQNKQKKISVCLSGCLSVRLYVCLSVCLSGLNYNPKGLFLRIQHYYLLTVTNA